MTRKQYDALERTQAHIARIIDTTPWSAAADRINWCRTCPGRSEVITSSGLETPCLGCPLRPLVVALAELQLRAAAAAKAADQKEHTAE